ncbi:MAG: hypothetical protein RBT74_06270 [Tenuifilaceae bacterium]|jgi:hypothetical protein|nr:hypothetical protein [Tenuifilaceae bacterium]
MKLTKSFLAVLLILIATACGVQRVPVGNYENVDCKPKTLTKGKDLSLFWELVPIRKVEKTIKITDYEKVVKRDIFDNIIFYGTAGIFSFKSVRIRVKDCEEQQNSPQDNTSK